MDQAGVSYHKRQEMLSKRRNLAAFGLESGQFKYQVKLMSDDLEIHGICDAIIFNGNCAFPLEFKLSSARPTRGHRIQLAAYGLLIEFQMGLTVDKGFILFGQRGQMDIINLNEWRQQVLDMVNDIKQTISQPLLPKTSATHHQCGQCEYLNFCADRF